MYLPVLYYPVPRVVLFLEFYFVYSVRSVTSRLLLVYHRLLATYSTDWSLLYVLTQYRSRHSKVSLAIPVLINASINRDLCTRKSPALRHGALAIDPTSMRCPAASWTSTWKWMNPLQMYTIYSYATMRTRLLISKQGGEVVVTMRCACCSAMRRAPCRRSSHRPRNLLFSSASDSPAR